MSIPPDFRQRVHELRARLNDMLQGKAQGAPPKGRQHIDTTGNRSRTKGYKTHEARLIAYAERRYTSVARMCVLLEVIRDSAGLALKQPRVGQTGAYWQAFGGNKDFNACHTCPCLLTFNGQLPTVLTTNRGLQRHLVVEFADCMLMPTSINGIDKLADEQFGRDAFVAAATHLLHTPGAAWMSGLDVFDSQMADIYENARLVLFSHNPHRLPREHDEEAALDTLCAYYEGMDASRKRLKAVENYRAEVLRERGIA
jgi:hypothetical protein